MKKIQLFFFILAFGAIQLKAENVSREDYNLVTNPYLMWVRTLTEFKNYNAITLLLNNGQPFSYPIETPQFPDNFIVSQIYSAATAFTALSTKGEIISWGDPATGGTTPANASNVSTNISSIVSNLTGFLALHNDGTLEEWGNLSLSADVQEAINSGKKVVQLYAGYMAFLAVLEDPNTHDQTLISWGHNRLDPNESLNKIIEVPPAIKVQTVVANYGAIAVLYTDGTIQSWGNPNKGGLLSPGIPAKGQEIQQVVAGQHAFAAMGTDRRIYAWGDTNYGGFNPTLPEHAVPLEIYANDTDFAVTLDTGDIFSWGLNIKDPKTEEHQMIISVPIIKRATSVGWGRWKGTTTGYPKDAIKCIIPNGEAFAAVTVNTNNKNENRILAWGNDRESTLPESIKNSTRIVKSIVPCLFSFTVLYADGTIQSWGKWADAKTDIVTPSLPTRADGTPLKVTALTSNLRAYMAILEDGSLFYWGGNCSTLADGSFQPSGDFSFGKSIFISAEEPTPKALWFASPFEKYIYNRPLLADPSTEVTDASAEVTDSPTKNITPDL